MSQYTTALNSPKPHRGEKVAGSVYVPHCVPGNPPLADYRFVGSYLGVCADGLMTSPVWRSDNGPLDTIFTRRLSKAP